MIGEKELLTLLVYHVIYVYIVQINFLLNSDCGMYSEEEVIQV